ncbi:MAG TPA: nucleoside kinase [Anaerolineaceae bacterium]|jgi:uridine kinase|nr:nucleoside kinase [Anaerolineaceae bacterium]NMC18151.1 nucleoside kinase [Chloroflexota bacterium]HNW14013.1 nucleoside kinase [Anaerolineaceae bacterium]HPD62492.1 nucleoside kinase [Anaerolineaceae bacterium]HQM54182.1 nucleoside kinase [Anaerolineaceae bacterium]
MSDSNLNGQLKVNSPRPTIEIVLPDGRVYAGNRGASLCELLQMLPEWDNPPIMGAVVNGELKELTATLEMDARVRLVTMKDDDGARIYRRSITFLLEAAFEELFPKSLMALDHSVSAGGYYCQVSKGNQLGSEDLSRLELRMRELVEADLPFERQLVPLDEAISYFESKGLKDKVQLLKYRQKEYLVLYRLSEHRDYHHGYMVPSTGYLKWFALQQMGEGFVLRFPRRESPKQLSPMPSYPKLLSTFRQYGNWLQRLGIGSVGELNASIDAGNIREIILVSEALHNLQIIDISQSIADKSEEARIILIAGPSSSGKTTFSKRLSIQLLAQGFSPFPIEMDNYFVDREKTPKDEFGQYNFEALGALDTHLLSDHLKRLIQGEKVRLPKYDFHTGKRQQGEEIQLRHDQMIILEGIHGLNPQLLPEIDPSSTYKIYVSCLTQLNLDRYNRISTTDTRLLRRIVRDARERGYTAQETISRWESVQHGEKEYIFPYQENADKLFNSALVYELSALRLHAEPLLRQVPYGTKEYVEAKRLLAFLEWFLPIDSRMIPDNSLMLEFLGGSILKDFILWK